MHIRKKVNIAGRYKVLVCETEQEAAVITKRLATVWDDLSETDKNALDELLEKQQVVHMRESGEQEPAKDGLTWRYKLNDHRYLEIYAEVQKDTRVREAKILTQLRKEAEALNKQHKVKPTRKRTSRKSTDFSGDPDIEETRKGLETGW